MDARSRSARLREEDAPSLGQRAFAGADEKDVRELLKTAIPRATVTWESPEVPPGA